MNSDVLHTGIIILAATYCGWIHYRGTQIRKYGALCDAEIVGNPLLPFGTSVRFTFEGELMTKRLRGAVFSFVVGGPIKVLYHPKYPNHVILCRSRNHIL